MDTAFRSLLRQYATNSDDNELAHKIARMAIRTTGPSEPKSFEEEIKEYQEFVEANTEALGDKIGASLQALIAKYPLVEAIQWTQYTPGFNDGDPCEFGVNDLNFKLRGEPLTEVSVAGDADPESEAVESIDEASEDESEDEEDYEEEDEDEEDLDDEDFVSHWELDNEHPSKKMLGEIVEVFTSIPEDLMEYAFGNGSKVTVSSADVKVTDYHDHE